MDPKSILFGFALAEALSVCAVLAYRGWRWHWRMCRRCYGKGEKSCYCMGGMR